MIDIIFFFEIYSDHPYINLGRSFTKNYIKFDESENFEHFIVTELSNDEFKKDFEGKLNLIIPEVKIKKFFYISFYFGQEFEFFIVLFNYRGSLSCHDLLLKIPEINQLIDQCPVILRMDRYFSSMYLNKSIRDFLENSLKIQILQTSIKFENNSYFLGKLSKKNLIPNHLHLGIGGELSFIIETLNFFPLNIKSKLETIITNYFNYNFPKNLMELPANHRYTSNSYIFVYNYSVEYFREFDGKEELPSFIYKTIKRELWSKIGEYTSIFSRHYLHNFYNWLRDGVFKYNNYDGRTLIKLKNYLEDLLKDYFSLDRPSGFFPRIFIQDFDNIGFKLYKKKDPNILLFKDDNNLFDLINRRYKGFFNIMSNLLEEYFNLMEQAKTNLDKINFLISFKQDLIKSFTKTELKNKLVNVKSENEFRKNILIPILQDFGYKDIQDIHGTHEYGIDILFKNENKFGIAEWNAIIAKIGNITKDIGTEISQNIRIIMQQSYEAKSMEHIEKNYGDVKITRIFIATNGKINYHAKKAIQNKDPLLEGNLFFLDCDLLLSLF